MRPSLWLVAACGVLLAGCGKDTRNLPGSAAGLGGAGDSAVGYAGAAAGGAAGAGDDGKVGEGATVAGGVGPGDLGGEAGTAGSDQADDCIDISHVESSNRTTWDLRMLGTGFEADEGSRVRVVVTFGGEPSYGLGQTSIRGGAFDLFLPGVIQPYTGIGVYVDRGRDDACTLGVDRLLQKTTGGVYGDEVWEVTPDEPNPAGASPCNINGIFDLTQRLRCVP